MKAAHAGLTEHYPWRRSRPEWNWCFEWPRAFTFQFKVQASTVLYAVLTGILVTSATISFMGTEASHPIVQFPPFFCPQAVPKRTLRRRAARHRGGQDAASIGSPHRRGCVRLL